MSSSVSEWMTHNFFLGLTKAISSSSDCVTRPRRGEVDWGDDLDLMCMPQIAMAE